MITKSNYTKYYPSEAKFVLKSKSLLKQGFRLQKSIFRGFLRQNPQISTNYPLIYAQKSCLVAIINPAWVSGLLGPILLKNLLHKVRLLGNVGILTE